MVYYLVIYKFCRKLVLENVYFLVYFSLCELYKVTLNFNSNFNLLYFIVSMSDFNLYIILFLLIKNVEPENFLIIMYN